MKMNLKKITIIGLVLTTLSFKTEIGPELKIGADIPKADLKLTDVSDKKVSINDAKNKNGVLVIFSCNTCPYVKLYEKRIKEITDKALQNAIGVIIINSNEAQRDEDDSFDEMKKYYKEQNLTCYYVLDNKTEIADAFGATRTPQVFLFNKEFKLNYKGSIDDNVKDAAAVKTFYLQDAIEATIKNSLPKVQESKSIGCTIKRNE